MKSGETILQSPLDKPLGEITEEDISQLTREDCRKYLKEKGMRRPSWNKSQAIQQVLSLKALVDSRTEDSACATAGIRQKFPLSATENQVHNASPSSDPSNSSGADLPIAVSANESISYRRKDPLRPDNTSDSSVIFPATGKGPFSPENNSISPSRGETKGPVAVHQMTIFYRGKVNVYDGVPSTKAIAIMELAGTPNSTAYDTAAAGDQSDRLFPCRFPVACVRTELASPQLAVTSPQSQTGPTSRKASLQRYLEKRKDRSRFKGRKKMVGSSSCSLEVYLNQPVSVQTPNRQSSGSVTCSPTRPKPPHTPARCSSVENQSKNLSFC